jgi:hypothetical protein
MNDRLAVAAFAGLTCAPAIADDSIDLTRL